MHIPISWSSISSLPSVLLQKKTLELYSRLFGDYPFAKEKYGFTNFENNGGMEHQTNSFVIGPTTTLIAHENRPPVVLETKSPVAAGRISG